MSIRTERRSEVLVVTIDRAQVRNALTLEMTQELVETWRSFAADDGLRVAVLTGVGDRAFCSGADLGEISSYYRSMTPLERRERSLREPGLGGLTRNLDPGKPVIAAINGHCLAGGLELALACDLRVAAEHATFGLPEVAWGIIPGAGGTQRLPRILPLGIALELLLTGDAIDAATALRIGLVNRVVAREDLLDEALDLASRIAKNAPLAVKTARAVARAGLHLPLDEALHLEQLYAEPLRQSDDAREGLAAFAEKRRPEFRGK